MIALDLEPDRIHGVNAVDNCKVRRLAQRMKQHGWQERSLLIEEANEGFFAWTGTHRLAAAELAGLPTIPCMVLSQSEADAAFIPVYGDRYGHSCWRQKLTSTEGSLDRHRLLGLERAGLTEAAAMLREEMAAPEG